MTNMEPLLLVYIIGSIVAVIVGILFYLHDRKARRWSGARDNLDFDLLVVR